MDLFIQMLVNGVTVGSTYALAAIGISLIFGILNIINLTDRVFDLFQLDTETTDFDLEISSSDKL